MRPKLGGSTDKFGMMLMCFGAGCIAPEALQHSAWSVAALFFGPVLMIVAGFIKPKMDA